MSVPGEVLLSAEVIHRRVETLAAEISRDYRDKPLLIVGVLKGSFIFLADLVRAMTIPVRLDFLGVASYGDGMISSGEVKVFKDLNEPVAGQDLLLVEDIVDSGRTTEVLLQLLQVRKPASIRLCTSWTNRPGGYVKLPSTTGAFRLRISLLWDMAWTWGNPFGIFPRSTD